MCEKSSLCGHCKLGPAFFFLSVHHGDVSLNGLFLFVFIMVGGI